MEKNGEKNTRKKQQQSPKTCQSGEQLSQLELLGRASMENLGVSSCWTFWLDTLGRSTNG